MEMEKIMAYIDNNKQKHLEDILAKQNTTNTVRCTECDGFGYVAISDDDMDVCEVCLGECEVSI